MESIKLYHGSDHIVGVPKYGYGNDGNDYGKGFYCTESLDLAKEWACSEAGRNGYANAYALDPEGLSVLNLCEPQYSILNWLALLQQNRRFSTVAPVALAAKDYLVKNFLPDTTGCDVIIGYRADDSYFSFARDFINNTISVEQLSRAMRLGKLGEQVVLISQRAFDRIEFLEEACETADSSIYYPLREKRDREAKMQYLTVERNQVVLEGVFVRDIITRGMQNGDFGETIHK